MTVADHMPREQLAARLLARLAQRHIGKSRGITAEQLAHEMGISERVLRSLVSDLRAEGTAISATPETGYFIAETPDELEESCQFLRSRALHSLRIEAQLRRIPLPDLLGQLRLET
ncbi:MAG: HTH domain-containing protein [Rubrivivax sp.]